MGTAFRRDNEHWLYRHSPEEWIRAALAEMRRAEAAYASHNAQGGLAGCRRAAGMALNGALIAEPRDGWGRTYLEHLLGLSRDATVPEVVRAACKVLLDAKPPSATKVIQLGSPRAHDAVLEAARDVMAHAYAVVKRNA